MAFPWTRMLGRVLARLTAPGTEQSQSFRYFMGGRTRAGVFVDHDGALRNATCWACVQYLSKTVAQLPWRVIQESENGDVEKLARHPTDYVLNQRANPEMGAFTWRQTMMGQALLWGNGYSEIERDGAGRVINLWPIHASRVTPRRDDTGALYYQVANGAAGVIRLDARDMFHVKGFGDGPVGFNVIEYAAQSIGWAQATELFGATFFGEGMNPSGVIEQERSLTEPALNRLKDEMKKFRGPGGEKTLYLDKGMKWTAVSRAPNEAQFIETRVHQVEEICRWFGVPPHKVMHLLRSTNNNIEHQSIEVVIDSVLPWVKVFEQEANFKGFGQNRQNLQTKMNLTGLLRGDSAARAALMKALFEVGALSPNGALRAEGLNTIGPVGDRYFVPANFIPLDMAGRNYPAAAPAAMPAAGEDPGEDPAEPNDPNDEPSMSEAGDAANG